MSGSAPLLPDAGHDPDGTGRDEHGMDEHGHDDDPAALAAGRTTPGHRQPPGRSSRGRSIRGRSSRGRFTAAESVAAVVLAFLVGAAVAPGLFTSINPLAINPAEAFAPPSAAHWFGTDESGRDIFSRVIHGARVSLLIGAAATVIGLVLALVLGALAGLGTRLLDFGVKRVLEVMFALPGLMLALVFIALAGPGTVTSVFAVGLATAPGYARILRSRLKAVRGSAMVEAAVVLGRSRTRILLRQILPNALAPVFVLGTLGLGQAIVWASSLSFLGLGTPPPNPEWGAMLASGRTYLTTAWWMTFFPGLFIVAAAAAATVLGRGLQRRAVSL